MAKLARPYQIECKNAVMDSYNKGIDSQLVVMATGTGKTYTACMIAEEFERILWITHEETLIDQSGASLAMSMVEDENIAFQIEEKIHDHGGLLNTMDFIDENPLLSMTPAETFLKENMGIIKRKRMDLNAKIVVASIQTLCRRLDKIDPNTFDLIIVDECHLSMAKTWKTTLDHFNHKLRLGLTATPSRLDGQSLQYLFKEITFEFNIKDAVAQAWLVEIDAIRIKTDISLDNVRTTAGELNQKDLQLVNCEPRNNLIVDTYEKEALGKQGLIFAVDVQHAMDIAQTFIDRGHNSVAVMVSDETITPDRRRIVKLYKKGLIDILINVMIATAGFDHPGIQWIAQTCPTKSLTKFLQQLGRGTRALPGIIGAMMDYNQRVDAISSSDKPSVKIFDFVDVTSKHRLVNTWTLDEGKEPEEQVFITTKTRNTLIEERQARETKIDRLTTENVRVNLLEMPGWEPSTSPRMQMPATEKQLLWLKRLGYDIDNNFYTKADAEKFISSQPISSKQLYRLRKEGYDAKEYTTIGEASLAFDEIKNRNKEKFEERLEQANKQMKSQLMGKAPDF